MIFLDFEYNNSNESKQDVVSVAYQIDNQPPVTLWLYRDPEAAASFKPLIEGTNHTLVAWQAQAEMGALLSLGINIDNLTVLDLAAEWAQLKNKNNNFRYGRVFLDKKKTKVATSVEGGMESGNSLVDVVMHQFGENLNSEKKNAMRDLILSRGRGASHEGVPFSDTDKANILAYNLSDITLLPSLLKSFDAEFKRLLPRVSEDTLRAWQFRRGEYIKSLARCERLGCPLDTSALDSLSQNHEHIVRASIEHTNSIFPVFIMNKKTGKYQFKQRMFTDELSRLGLLDTWARTEKGGIKKDEDTLSDNKHIPEIKALHDTNKVIQQLKWFRPDAIGEFKSRVGSDGRLRSFLGPFGTQTGRNAAKAKTYVFAMSSWLRCLIKPPSGMAITGVDYSSQEFAVAAALSGDSRMIAAYQSGDPYLYFAKAAGAVPENGTREEYSRERNLFKATTLGLQYGMGVKKLAKKLSYDMGEIVTEREASKLITLHKKVFRAYWDYLHSVQHVYFDLRKPLTLRDGWTLWLDNDSALSVRNFPVQGTGASIMRRAVVLAHEAGLDVITPLHDAMYILHKEEDTYAATETLKSCMARAVSEFISLPIRLDVKTITAKKPWVEDKGRDDFEKFKQFLYKGE